MSLSFYLWGIRFFTLMTLIAWLGVVFFFDPHQTGFIGLVIFSLSLFVFLTGIFLLFVIWIYRKGLGDTATAENLAGAFRQSLLLSLFVMGIVFFQYNDILLWWDALLLFAGMLLVEFSFRRFINNKDE
ncbi:MAG: hypothetical protein PHH40_03235 [Candidatus Moranbacteria bacterium]|nr:hypothetical protein [Candidatus Moranbacteria bacterium]MDD3964738.1 hypothetical protein [Candidatus Moranbacteria bacterium]